MMDVGDGVISYYGVFEFIVSQKASVDKTRKSLKKSFLNFWHVQWIKKCSLVKVIFTKCAKDDVEAEEYMLLLMKPTGKSKILSFLLAFAGAAGLCVKINLIPKALSRIIAVSILLVFLGTFFSTGGIEQDESSWVMNKRRLKSAAWII